MASLSSRILPFIFILVGAGIATHGTRSLLRAKASTHWPTADGIIENSEVEYHKSRQGSGTYRAKVMYAFEVDGTKYNGDRIAYGDYGSSDTSHAQEIVDRYPIGKTMEVYYLPDTPEVNLLEAGARPKALVFPAIGYVFFIAGSYAAIAKPTAAKKQKP